MEDAVHVAVVGAGALGAVYGARLANAGATVTFVVRSIPEGARPIAIERVENGERHRVEAPRRATAVPADADVILVCVRYEQLDAALASLLAPSAAPVVTMTPLLPQDRAFLEGALGASRLVPGMPGVVGYRVTEGEDAFRYWLPRLAPTAVEAPDEGSAVARFVAALDGAGVRCVGKRAVFETNAASTMTFVALTMGLDVAGGADALLEDAELLALAQGAAGESRALAQRFGSTAAWASAIGRLLTGSTLGGRALRRSAMKAGLALARRAAPEGVAYFEEHFGHKLHAQHVAMAGKLVELAAREGVAHDALERLLTRLRTRGRSTAP